MSHEPRQSSLRSRESTSRQDQTSTGIPSVNRKSGKDISLSRIRNENLNQKVNSNEFSDLSIGSRKNNLKESYLPSRTSSRFRNEQENLNAKASEILERRSSIRGKINREIPSRSSTSFIEHETLTTKESEISERRTSRRGKNSISYVEVSTEFPSRRQTSISNVQDASSQLTRTRSRTVKNDPKENTPLIPIEKLETYNSPPTERLFTEVTTFPTRATSQIAEEIPVTETSIKLNPRTRNLNTENNGQTSSIRTKSRTSSVDSDMKPTRNRNIIRGRTSRITEGRQDSIRSRNEEDVRGNTRTRISDNPTAPSSQIRGKEIKSSTRSETDDGKRASARTRNKNEPQTSFRSRNTDFSRVGLRPTSEDIQTEVAAKSNIARGQLRSKELLSVKSSSRQSNNDEISESIRARSEDYSRVRSRNENTPRGSSRSRNEDISRNNGRAKTEDVTKSTIRSRNGGSSRLRGKNIETEENYEPNNAGRSKKEEIVLPKPEQIESSSIDKVNSEIVENSNLPTVSSSTPSQDESLPVEIKNEATVIQESSIDISSSSIGYEVQEATEPLIESSSTAPVEAVTNAQSKTNDNADSLLTNNNRNEFKSKSDNSRFRSRSSNVRNTEESFIGNGEKEVVRTRNEGSRRSRIRDSDGISTERGTSRGRNLKTENLPIAENSRRRKVQERSNIETRRSSDSRGQTGIAEIENSRTIQRDSIETRISSRKRNLTPDQTQTITRPRFSSKNHIEELSQNYKKDIETSNSALRSVRYQGTQQGKKEDDVKLEPKETTSKHSVEETLNARRSSFRNKVKDDSNKENETKSTRGRGTYKQSTDGKRADQEVNELYVTNFYFCAI